MMNIPFFDLRRQYDCIRDEIDRAMAEVHQKGWYILGDNLSAFEDEFAQYCGCKFGIGVGSGTDAIYLALLACAIKEGDEVITVPNTAAPTVSAICMAGATPVFVDVDEKTYNMDPEKLNELLERRTTELPKAIIPVHLYGQPADIGPLLGIARTYNLKVIEDACQAHGAVYYSKLSNEKRAENQIMNNDSRITSRRVGSFGHAAAFSFYPTKNLGCYGDGGMVVTNDEDIFHKVRLLRNYGQTDRYHHKIKGVNSRLDELQAAILRVKLRYLDSWNERRKEIAEIYHDSIRARDITKPIEMAYGSHVYHLYVIRTWKREKLQNYLKQKGIEALIHYPIPVHLQKAYEDLGAKEGDFPVAEKCSKQVLSLPIYPELEEKEISKIVNVINEFCK